MLTIGTIDYLNTQPVEYHLMQHTTAIEIVRGVPTAINHALLTGQVVLAPISAYTFAQHTDELLLVPGLSIATLGAVNSVMLFSWRSDPRELDGLPVALSDHSATSNALLRVLCEQHYQCSPVWHVLPQDLDTMLQQSDGALLIGDKALFEATVRRHSGRRGLPYCFDLGDEWLKLTGLPFTFAVWAVRADAAERVAAAGIVPALHASLYDGLHTIDKLALAYAPRLGVPTGVCTRYLRNLRYTLNAQDKAGWQLFLRYALPDVAWHTIREFSGE